MNVPWRHRLTVRLTVMIAVAVALTLGGLSWQRQRAQERHVVGEVLRGAATLSDTIRISLRDRMLDGRHEQAYGILDAISRQQGIERLRIYNRHGRVRYSSDPAEIGTQVTTRSEPCRGCHGQGRPLTELDPLSRSRITRAPDGHRVLGTATAIHNESGCAVGACHMHPADQAVLGVVDVTLSLAAADRTLAQLRSSSLLGAAAAVLLLSSAIALLTRRMLERPVAAVVDATQRVARGDLAHRVPVHARDEIGILAESFNGMAEELERAQREIQGLLAGLEQQVEDRTAALKQAQAQLIQSEKMVSLGRLSASIAHEINNPLAGILTYAKLVIRALQEGPLAAEEQAEALRSLELVRRETERCTAIVRNLLDFARQRPLALQELRLESVVDEALSLVAHQLALKGVSIEKSIEALPAIRGDFGQLRQAFVNIALNACDAMRAGGCLRVGGRALPESGQVELCFQDDGAGIAPEHLQRIFDPFFSTKEKGTGLGLSVVYGIVRRLGGRLDVESRLGAGTTLRVQLPAHDAAAQADAE